MKIEHIALYVNDLEGARKFFMKYLGAQSNGGYHNPKTNFRSYFLSFDDGARLEIINKLEMTELPKDLVRTGYAQMAITKAALLRSRAIRLKLRCNLKNMISRRYLLDFWIKYKYYKDMK